MRVGQEHSSGRGGSDGPGQTVEVFKLEESKEKDTVLVGMELPEKSGTQQRRQLRSETCLEF